MAALQELSARLLQHLTWDAEQSRPNRDLAAQMGPVRDLLLSMHRSGRPGTAWGCLANIVAVEDPYWRLVDEVKFEKNFLRRNREVDERW